MLDMFNNSSARVVACTCSAEVLCGGEQRDFRPGRGGTP